MTSFTEDLAVTLSLTINNTAYSVPAGNIKSLDLNIMPYGFDGELSLVMPVENTTDTLFTPLTGNTLIEVSLQASVYINNTEGTTNFVSLTGYVSTWGFSEQTLTNVLSTQELMLYRVYHLTFADPAQIFWKQHYPTYLLTNSTLQTLITAQTPTQIKMTYNWSVLTTQYPVLSLSLGATSNINRASFYDYLIWLVDTQNGVFLYDIATNQYTLSANVASSGTAESLNPLEIAKFGMNYPEVRRYQANVLNAYSASPATTSISNSQMVSPIRHDYIESYPIASNMTSRVTLETARMNQPLTEVWIEYQKIQLQFTPPGQLVEFNNSSAWNSSIFVYGKTYNVKTWRLNARAVDENFLVDLNNAYGKYTVDHSIDLKTSTDLSVSLPFYNTPIYPFFVEGTMVSESGAATDSTYQFYTDSTTSANYYQISIPLWANQNVRANYQPNFDAGQFYFPPYKNARVLVGLGFDNAYISAFLDWGTGTALTLDSQGNQLVMGQSTTSQNIIKHSYVDSKPELQIQRTDAKDTELLQFSDGYIILQTLLGE